MMPYIAYALPESLEVPANATRSLEGKYLRGIRANRERCTMDAGHIVGLAALYNQEFGFMVRQNWRNAQRATGSGKSVKEVLGEAERRRTLSRRQQWKRCELLFFME